MCPSLRFVVLPLLALASQAAPVTGSYLPNRDTPVPADQPIPAVDFVRPRLFERPQLNPSGTHFAAFTKTEDLKTILLVGDVATGKIEWTETEVYQFEWIDDTRLELGSVGVRNLRVVEVGNLRNIVDGFGYMLQFKEGLRPDSGYLWTRGWPDYVRTNRNARSQDFTVERSWFLPENGELAYWIVVDNTGRRKLQRLEKQKWIDCPVDCDEITPIDVGAQASEMIVLGPRAKGKPRAIQRMNVVTGALGEVIYQDPSYDCRPHVSFKRGTREINGVSVANGAEPQVWLSDTLRATQALMQKQFPGVLVQILSTDLREVRFLIEVQSDRQPPIYYSLDLEKKSLGLIKNTAPWIDPARMLPTRMLIYKTRDGMAIEGYLTLPAGASKEHPVPLIVGVHGGPWTARQYWGWNQDAQFFANLGYAYFLPHYRGSAGYDSRIEPADRFAFDKMRNDINAGVRALAKSGHIDPKRVAIEGIGFGGYLALSAVVQEPALYQCAIVYGGIYDWEKAFHKPDSRNKFEERWLQEQLRRYDQHPPAPLKDFAQIKIPVFFTRNVLVRDITFEDQMREMHHTLKGHSPVVNFGDLNLYREDDAYGELVTRAQQIEKFLGQHLTTQ
jgi:pimeloyl-ACP methyl ester carboxylesterase